MLTLDPTVNTVITAIVIYGLTAVAKALGLPDATAPARAFAAVLSLLLPILLAWHNAQLAAVDWNQLVPAALEALKILTAALVAYLAATGLHHNVKTS